jgi:hypothetical protein
LRLQVGLVLQQRVLEQLPLFGGHRLALGAELPTLQPCQLEGDLLDLRVAPGDVAVLALQQLLLELEFVTAYFSPSWTAFQADGGRDFSVIVDGVSV